MGVINVESLTKPIEGENPCGENLRWDRAYLELENIAKGKEENQFQQGEEPDWREVRDKGVELLARGRHLRIAVLVTVAAVRMEGYPGLRDGLAVIRGWLETYWDHIWPVLDAEDNNDPTERVNSLAAMATPLFTFGDTTKLLDRVYESPICESRQLGRFSLKDLAIAAGTLEDKTPPKEGEEAKPKPTLDVIDGAFAETDKERLEEIAKAAEEADGHAEAISQIFVDKCGAGIGPDVTALRTILKDAITQIRRRLGQEVPGDDGTAGGDGSGGGGGGGSALSGDVRNSQEASRALDKVIQYYEANEPSSPVPLVCRAAQRLVGRPYNELVRVMAADLVTTLENIVNPPSS